MKNMRKKMQWETKKRARMESWLSTHFGYVPNGDGSALLEGAQDSAAAAGGGDAIATMNNEEEASYDEEFYGDPSALAVINNPLLGSSAEAAARTISDQQYHIDTEGGQMEMDISWDDVLDTAGDDNDDEGISMAIRHMSLEANAPARDNDGSDYGSRTAVDEVPTFMKSFVNENSTRSRNSLMKGSSSKRRPAMISK